MERISLIMDKTTREMVMSEKTLARLSKLGELSFNDGCGQNKALKNATVAITSWGNTTLDAAALNEAPELKLVCHAAGSVKPIVSDELWNRGIRVTSSNAPLGMGVAETALGFTISASKNFYALNENISKGGWNEGKENIRELYDLRVGVVGFGWAGRHYAELMRNFLVDVVVYDPFMSADAIREAGAEKVEFEELLRTCDIVSVHAPSLPETFHMFNAGTLGLMKKDAVLINTARGALIDEQALAAHMRAGNLKYACLDVTDPEPPAADSPLRSIPNVILTPHLAGLSQNGLKRIGHHVCEEIERFLSGERMIAEVTRDMLAKMA